MNGFNAFLTQLHQWIWGPPLLLLLFGTGSYLTIVLKGVQFRYLGYSFRQLFRPGAKGKKGDISPIASLMTSLSGAIGTGSIVGVATAIAIGGVGTLFWMWITTLFTLATKYSESVLAVKYRETDSRGEMTGGPMHYIRKGLGWNKTAALFALLGIFAAIGTGNLVQINSIAEASNTVWQVPSWITGIVVSFVTMLIALGGVRSIGRVAVILVPFMALFYLCGGLFVLFCHMKEVPEALWLICKSAFCGQAALGGFVGSTILLAMQMGVARSVFSNEAGLGIASISSAAAKTDNPCRQAFLTMTGAVFSTLVVCTITGLAIAVTQSHTKFGADGIGLSGASLVIEAFQSTFEGGQYIVSLGLILFAFSTMIAWAYYGEKCCEAVFGKRSVLPYRLIYGLMIVPGAMMKMEIIWKVADICNGLIAIPNLLALFLLAKVVAYETERFTAAQIPSKTPS